MHDRHTESDRGPRFRLLTLGDARLVRISAEDVTLDVLGPNKAFALLTYLACSARRTATREHLINLLWADLTPDQARHSLRQAVWYLRQRLGSDGLVTDNGDLVLTAPLAPDRDEFLKAVDVADLERAVSIYRGDFLPGFAVPGGVDFEQWVDNERYRLRMVFVRTAEVVVSRRLSRGAFREAKMLARRVRDLDPGSESGWRLLLETLAATRDEIAVATERDALQRLLVEQSREPEPATQALLRLTAEEPDSAEEDAQTRGLVPELVGRQREFALLVDAWHTARRGRAGHVHVSAPAGLGKTRLLLDLRARLRIAGASVRYVRANPGDRHLSDGFAAELAAAACDLPGAVGVAPATAATLVALNPELSSRFAVRPHRSRTREVLRERTLALAELVRCVADEEPVALLLDDTHWMDAESRRIITAILGRLRDAPVLIVTAGRPHPEARIVAAESAEIALAPLAAADVQGLLASLGALPAEPWADALPGQLHEATGGSPLLVLETLQFALEREMLVQRNGTWHCPDPETLATHLDSGDALRHRVAALSESERQLLLVLAVAGTPLASTLLSQATERDMPGVDTELFALERRGLLARTAGGWEPAHDEIAALAERYAAPERVTAAHECLGRALLQRGTVDSGRLARAGSHLHRAGNAALLHAGFRRWITALRREGDRRPLRELATEYAGADAPNEVRRALVRRLPLRIRLGLVSAPRIAAAAGVVALLGVGTALMRSPGPPPDAVLFLLEPDGDSNLVAATAPIHRDRWGPDTPLRRSGAGRFPLPLGYPNNDGGMRPGHDGFVRAVTFPDSGGIDMVYVTPAGRERLTFAPGDDDWAGWSPDGRSIVFRTARWNAMSWYDLAIVHLGTGTVRPLLRHPTVAYSGSHWSPDGTRIVFYADFRGPLGSVRDSICTITADGVVLRCFGQPNSHDVQPAGWLDADRVLLFADSAGQRSLHALDIGDGTTRPLNVPLPSRVDYVLPAPDGRWIATRRRSPESPAVTWSIRPLDRPDLAREIRLPEGGLLYWGWAAARSRRYLDTLHLIQPEGPLPLTAPFTPSVRGADAQGNPVAPHALSWRVADTSIATIDANGSLWPQRTGVTSVHVSAGGWRADSIEIAVRPAEFAVQLIERWSEDHMDGWRTYGVPEPGRAFGPDSVRGFWNAGDGSFFSGAYSRRQFSPARGLGIDIFVSVSFDSPQWQGVLVELMPSPDSAVLAAWDHRTGYAPGSIRPARGGCTVAYYRPDSLGFLDEGPSVRMPVAVQRGEWIRMTLQVLPDGTCGLAVEGTPLARSRERFALDRPYRVYLEGHSWRTTALHGPLEVWEGVRPDIDWRALRERRD